MKDGFTSDKKKYRKSKKDFNILLWTSKIWGNNK